MTPLVGERVWFSSPLAPEVERSDEGFGAMVALSGDTAVTSAFWANKAYVYTYSDGWEEQATLRPPEAPPGQAFGGSVAISGDTVVVGASTMAGPNGEPEQGAVFVFERDGKEFGQGIPLRADDGAGGHRFGSSVAIEGDTLVVGAVNAMNTKDEGAGGAGGAGGTEVELMASGAAYVFKRSGGEWQQVEKLVPDDGGYWGDSFGQSVAISGDTVVVGAPITRNDDGAPNCGAAYVFTRTGEDWDDTETKLMLAEPYLTDEFGHDVAIDGNILVIGAWRSRGRLSEFTSINWGAAYVYTNEEGSWAPLGDGLFQEEAEDQDHFGASVAVSGETVMIATQSANSVYVFSPRESDAPIQVLGGRDLVEPYGGEVALDGDLGLVGLVLGTGVPYALERAVDLGDACESDVDCRSDHCADGVCCDRACDGDCEACGTGTCVLTPGDPGLPTCEPYLCGAASGDCPKECSSSDDCIETHYCREGECKVNLPNGESCASSRDCASGACVGDRCRGSSALGEECSSDTDCESEQCTDEVCCDTACPGQCEACNVKGSVGTCSPVTGEPRGKRADCDGGDGVCAGTCNGRTRNRCAYPDSDEPCGASCAEGEQTQSFCDGQGSCRAAKPQSCNGYDCADDRTCRTSCETHSDCVGGFTCSTEGTCGERAVCVEESTSMSPDGELMDCAAFRCGPDGTCLTECTNVDDCSPGNVCDREGGCVPLPTEATPPTTRTASTPARGSGCACRTAGNPRSSAGSFGLLLAFGLLVRHRRRRTPLLRGRSRARGARSPR